MKCVECQAPEHEGPCANRQDADHDLVHMFKPGYVRNTGQRQQSEYIGTVSIADEDEECGYYLQEIEFEGLTKMTPWGMSRRLIKVCELHAYDITNDHFEVRHIRVKPSGYKKGYGPEGEGK